jgi:hypothetical protein
MDMVRQSRSLTLEHLSASSQFPFEGGHGNPGVRRTTYNIYTSGAYGLGTASEHTKAEESGHGSFDATRMCGKRRCGGEDRAVALGRRRATAWRHAAAGDVPASCGGGMASDGGGDGLASGRGGMASGVGGLASGGGLRRAEAWRRAEFCVGASAVRSASAVQSASDGRLGISANDGVFFF